MASLGRLMHAIQAAGGVMFVTADHGNAEQMYDEHSHQKHTQHTLNRVPALLFNAPAGGPFAERTASWPTSHPPCWP
jgi:2,3-bisphosphoglycerate-independent phosphoglycerate mutase